MREYLIKYIKFIQEQGYMNRESHTIIMTAPSARKAWDITIKEESDYNGLKLIDVRRI